jgi:hypothetical protein
MTTVKANGVALGVEHLGDAAAPLVLLAGATTMLSSLLTSRCAHLGSQRSRWMGQEVEGPASRPVAAPLRACGHARRCGSAPLDDLLPNQNAMA